MKARTHATILKSLFFACILLSCPAIIYIGKGGEEAVLASCAVLTLPIGLFFVTLTSVRVRCDGHDCPGRMTPVWITHSARKAGLHYMCELCGLQSDAKIDIEFGGPNPY